MKTVHGILNNLTFSKHAIHKLNLTAYSNYSTDDMDIKSVNYEKGQF